MPQVFIEFTGDAGDGTAETPRPAHQDSRYDAHIAPWGDSLTERNAERVYCSQKRPARKAKQDKRRHRQVQADDGMVANGG